MLDLGDKVGLRKEGHLNEIYCDDFFAIICVVFFFKLANFYLTVSGSLHTHSQLQGYWQRSCRDQRLWAIWSVDEPSTFVDEIVSLGLLPIAVQNVLAICSFLQSYIQIRKEVTLFKIEFTAKGCATDNWALGL